MARDPYAVLGIPRSATLAQAEEAYLRRMRLEHPDVHHLAGPERVAEAETIARDLTGAIHAVRAERAVRADVGAPSAPPSGTPSEHDVGERPEDEPVPTAECPWCGERFVRGAELKDHVFDEHDLRLDRQPRPGIFGGRWHRFVQAAAHLPLWGVIPINLLLATVIGLLVAAPTNESLGWWAATITMAPTFAALIDRAFDVTR